VCALEGNQLKVSRGFDVDIRVKDEDLIHYSRILYQALATEFFLHSPCILGLTAIRRAIEALNSECVLQYLMVRQALVVVALSVHLNRFSTTLFV